jgi:large subunit ribosomal protein L3
MRMGGHMGDVRITTQGLEVVDVRPDENLIFVRGSVPGARGAVVEIKKSKKAMRGAAHGKG